MTKKQIILAIILADFVAFNCWVIWSAGFGPAFEQAFASPWSTQIAVDLCLAIGAIMVWMKADATKRGVNPWPWLALTLFTGSIGWLAYLVTRPDEVPARNVTQAQSAEGRAILAA